ncbi:Nodulation-signaling pathway 1 protein [Dichanthelium oligosanthes]|uniref:Nodulation-signaling pathway 1 protein n=1 Tax=Dichanthelium oligosanthes TaxID=888268 RepID=A0A1E5VA73_9POAL|nr:Nodulation-signaling pathway 1 protein [Dichanthelium oligosanthes]
MSNERRDQEPAAATGSSASDWLDESIAFLAADLDLGLDAYGWLQASAAEQQGIDSMVAETLPPQVSTLPQSSLGPVSTSVGSSPVEFGQPRKLKSPQHSRQRCPVGGGGGRGGPELDKGGTSCNQKPSKKGSAKAGAATLNRDARWAEQLLNPCAVAIESGNLPRAQHLLYVLGELASFSGEQNHRLAAHGLRALALRLPAAVGQAAAATIKMPSCECPTPVFSGVDPRLFRASLIRFNEVSPWFAVPNALANGSIALAASTRGAVTRPHQIHVVDIGVSHGVQWPTLLEALTRVPRGSTPPSVRLTVAGPAATPAVPFSASPPGYDCSPQLLRYAKTINLDLAIVQAPSLDTLHGILTPGETVIVCLQFRLGHAIAEEQVAVLRNIRSLNPELVVLAELDCGGRSDGSAASEFAARLEHLWTFLDSTAAAFKGRDADERRVMEAEAGTALAATARRGATVGGGREALLARLAAAGFEEAAFGAEALETAKALLRKYDGGWELVPPSPSSGAAVGLRWKRQPVSFCSMWRPAQASTELTWRGA